MHLYSRMFIFDVGPGYVGGKTYCKFPELSGTSLMHRLNLNHTDVKQLFEGPNEVACKMWEGKPRHGHKYARSVHHKHLSNLS